MLFMTKSYDSREMFLEVPMLDSPELFGSDIAMFQDHLIALCLCMTSTEI